MLSPSSGLKNKPKGNQHEAGSKQSNTLMKSLGLYGKMEGIAKQLISSHWLSQRTR
jgi:hypothetical protein